MTRDARVDYDSLAQDYDRRYLINDYSGIEQALIAFVGQDLCGRVLEVGCGTGRWLWLLGEAGIRTAGVDASANMLDYAHAQAPAAALAQGRAEDLPWAGAVFERVFCINAFHHFDDKVRALTEARRVLRPGAEMMTIGLDPHTGIDRWYIYEYFEPAFEIDRRRYPSTARIRDWMRALQFSNVHTREVQHIPGRLPARAALDERRLDKGMTSQLAVLTDEQYQRGIDRIRRDLESAEARGEMLYLCADLRVYGTYGSVPC